MPVTQEELQKAAMAIREAAAAHGTNHPEVLNRVETYVDLLRKADKYSEAIKFEERAAALRQVLIKEGKLPASGSPAPAATVAAPAAQPAPAPAPAPAPKPAAPKVEEDDEIEVLSGSGRGGTLGGKSSSGAFDLDDGDELEVLSGSGSASSGASKSAPAPAKATTATPTKEATGERPLFDSGGTHICTEFEGHVYSPDGRYIGRWEQDLEVYIDKKGNYLGQIYEDNRFARDTNWQFKHMNFGARSPEGDRAGWGRVADISPTTFPRDFDDVKFD